MSLHIPLGGVNIGDIMALGASGCLAVYLIMTRMGNRGMSNSVFTYSLFLFTSAWLFLMVILFGQGFSLSSHDLPYAIAMALGPQLGGNSLVNFSLRYLPPSVVSVALLGEPIIATLASFILFGEVISWQTVVGGLFICLGLYAVLKENGTQGA
jgi:drug/metabolite transporter (DMT)-like permease